MANARAGVRLAPLLMHTARNEGTDKKCAFASSHSIYMALHQFNLLFRLLSGLGLANMGGGRGW